jgi:hypothetical protein
MKVSSHFCAPYAVLLVKRLNMHDGAYEALVKYFFSCIINGGRNVGAGLTGS